MEDRTEIPECCESIFPGIRKKVTYIFKADRGLGMNENISYLFRRFDPEKVALKQKYHEKKENAKRHKKNKKTHRQ